MNDAHTQPDPAGARLAVLKPALAQLSYIEGFFFDFSSCYQTPRTENEDAIFKRALEGGTMNQLYSSAVGTTVLQAKEIPPQPTEFDGWLCLFGVVFGVDFTVLESAIRSKLSRFGTIVAIVDRRLPPVGRDEIAVRFASHGAVLKAVKAAPASDAWKGLGALYNDRPYNERGWCAAQPWNSGNCAPRTRAALQLARSLTTEAPHACRAGAARRTVSA